MKPSEKSTMITQLSPSPTIRRATAADLPGVEQLLGDAGLTAVGVQELLPTFMVADTGNGLAGVAGLEVCCENALLRSVAVNEEWRSRGVGRALVNQVVADAESRGIRALYLLTTTADRYFPSLGFTVTSRDAVPDDVKESEEYRSICPASAVVMVRELEATSPQ
jgi:amino-acid N-acetyltransferase